MPKRAFFVRIRTQFDNLGDALINRELLRLLGQHGDVTIDRSAAPDRFLHWIKGGIPPRANQTGKAGYWLGLMSCILRREECWVVLNPGGYVGEIGRLGLMVKLLGVLRLRLLRRLGCKTLLVGVSYERLGPRLLHAIQLQSRELDVHAPRDTGTARYCAANDIRATGLLPDLAFAVPPYSSSDPSSRVLASFREQAKFDPIAELLRLLPAKQGVTFSWQVASDAPAQVDHCERWKALGNSAELADLNGSIDEARHYYATCGIVLSNRLHVLILAMSVGALPIPVLGLGQSNKIRGLYADLGLAGLIGRHDLRPDCRKGNAEQRKAVLDAYREAHRALWDGFAKLVGDS